MFVIDLLLLQSVILLAPLAMAKDKYVRFDWAAKRMLRDKANFCVLEGLITVLLGEEVHIDEILW